MLDSLQAHKEITAKWDQIQQPVHGTGYPADALRLLAALDEGWQIVESAKYLARGTNAENSGYLLTLLHPRLLLTRECSVSRSLEMDALLDFESVPGYKN